MSKKTEALEVILGLMPNAKFIDKNGKDVTEDVKKSHNVAKNVAQRNSQDLTEQYQKRTLKNGFYYFDNGKTQYIVEYRNIKGIEGLDGVKVLAPVPSYEEWQPFTDPYFRGLTTKDIAELAKKSIRLTTQHCEDNARIEKLEELLKECRNYVVNTPVYPQGDNNKQAEIHRLVDKINEALK